MKRVIITGATSLIGSALCTECLELGMEVVAVVRPNSLNLGELPTHKNLYICENDLANIKELPQKLNGGADCFFHLAWLGTGRAQRGDWKIQTANIQLTLEALEAAAALKCSRFVGTGSQAEYGPQSGVLSPKTLPEPVDAYGASKLAAFQLSRAKSIELGIHHVWARIFSVYGPHDNKDTLITSLANDFLKGFATSLTPCEQLWDYLYVTDAACALRLIAEKGNNGKVYCVGSGYAKPLREYIEEAAAAVKATVFPIIGAKPYGKNQVMHLTADIRSLSEDTGFVPQVGFADGFRKTYEWLEEVQRKRLKNI